MGKMLTGSLPAYIEVYNSLYSDIMNNVYLEGEQLPSENALSEKYGVSRNTLRQALAILCEDGLVIKSQGKGTTIARREDSKLSGQIINPMTNMCKSSIDDIELHYNYAPPTDIGRTKLNLGKSEIVLASTNIYKSNQVPVGYSFTQIPASAFEALDMDISNDSALEDLIEHKIFDVSSKGNMSVQLIASNEEESRILEIPEGTPLLLSELILFNHAHQAFSRCKFYMLPEFYKMEFQI